MTGILCYKPTCPLCIAVAWFASILDVRQRITIRPLTREEFDRFRAPIFLAPNETIIGVIECSKRVFWELFLPNDSNFIIHGDGIRRKVNAQNPIMVN